MLRLSPPARVAVLVSILGVLTLLAPVAAGAETSRPAADHVILVSIDGLRPEAYLDPSWPTPMLQQMARLGARAEAVDPPFPSVTYPGHTTIVTGVAPAVHGIISNRPFLQEEDTERWFWEADDIRAPTLWEAVRAAGGTTAALGWPVTVGAPIDWLIPETWPLDAGADFIEHVREHTRPAGLLAEIEREATGRLRRETFTIAHMTRDVRAGEAAAWILESRRPTLLLLHLFETDHFQHEDGRSSDQVRRAFAAADRAVSELWETAERIGILDRTAFVVTGDHGHVDVHTRLAPNRWLVEAGLREQVRSDGPWKATFHGGTSSAFLHLAVPDDHETLAEVRRILAGLPEGTRRRFRILERDEIAALGGDPRAVLALDARPGITFARDAKPPAIRAAHGATHGYAPTFPEIRTGLVAAGAGLRAGAVASRLDLRDVAPLVAALLGLEGPRGGGSLPVGFLTDPPRQESPKAPLADDVGSPAN